MIYLHKGYCNSGTTYPLSMSGFVRYLVAQGWTIKEERISGGRALDFWMLSSPHGEVVEVVSWMEGQSIVSTQGGLVLLTDSQMRENAVSAEIMYMSPEERTSARRKVEDALRKNTAFFGSVLRLALATKAIKP